MSAGTGISFYRSLATPASGCRGDIILIYLASLAVRQQSQTIRFRTAGEMLDTFALHKGGREYRRLVSAFERIFGATIFFGTDAGTPRARVVQRTRLSFSAKLRFGTVVIRTSAQLTINFRTSSCSAMSSIGRSHPTRFLRTWSKSRHSPTLLRY